ncbi:hypothetical protein [Geminocystis sp. GBBB08]|uniref:DUF7219 family protein n=1 Tax=Geminocystis sp. GBBB08 TaxID=2604140 RepID=UPI0027E318F2|nr:hypothetical protein [Geminocystis sp. GBBB08]
MTDNDKNQNQRDKENFIFPHASYRGEFSPENLVFNANLQEFAQKVSYVCNLETNGKISSQSAYLQIKNLWKELKASMKNLGLEEKK